MDEHEGRGGGRGTAVSGRVRPTARAWIETRLSLALLAGGAALGAWIGSSPERAGDVAAWLAAPSPAVSPGLLEELRDTDERIAEMAASDWDRRPTSLVLGVTSRLQSRDARLEMHVRRRGQAYQRCFEALTPPDLSAVEMPPPRPGPGDREQRVLRAHLAAAPLGVTDPQHSTRQVAIAWWSIVALQFSDADLFEALRDAGVSAAEALVLARAGWQPVTSSALSCVDVDGDVRASPWQRVVPEMLAVARDPERIEWDRHAAVEAAAAVAYVPPSRIPPRSVEVDVRADAVAREWDALCSMGYEASLGERLAAMIEGASSDELEGDRVLVTLGLAVAHDPAYRAAVTQRLRGESVEDQLLALLGLSPEADDASLVALVDEDPRRIAAQWALALRLARRTGTQACPAPGAWHVAAEWCVLLGLDPPDARVTVDWLDVDDGLVRARTEQFVVSALHPRNGRSALPWLPLERQKGEPHVRLPGTWPVTADPFARRFALPECWLSIAPVLRRLFDPLWRVAEPPPGRRYVRHEGGVHVRSAPACVLVPSPTRLPTRWAVVTVELDDGASRASTWQGRVERALRAQLAVLETAGDDRPPRDDGAMEVASVVPVPGAADDIGRIRALERATRGHDARERAVLAEALAGRTELLARERETYDSLWAKDQPRGTYRELLGDGQRIALLATCDDAHLEEALLRDVVFANGSPQVARTALRIAERRGIRMSDEDRDRLVGRAAELDVARAFERRPALWLGPVVTASVLLLGLFVVARTLWLRRSRRVPFRAAACLVVSALALVLVDWEVLGADLLPDAGGYVLAALGCLVLAGRRSPWAWCAAGAFAAAAVLDAADVTEAVLPHVGIRCEVLGLLGVLALPGVAADLARERFSVQPPPPRRPARASRLAAVGVLLALGVLLWVLPVAAVAEALSQGEEVPAVDLARVLPPVVAVVVAAVAVALRRDRRDCGASVVSLPLPFALGLAAPLLVLDAWSLSSRVSQPVPWEGAAAAVPAGIVAVSAVALAWCAIVLLDAASRAAGGQAARNARDRSLRV